MRIIVGKRLLTIVKGNVLNENEYRIDSCNFEFDEVYNGLVKMAVFTKDNNSYLVGIYNDTCEIPSDVLKTKGSVSLGVYAYKQENGELSLMYSPKPDTFGVEQGSYVEDTILPSDPTLSPFLTVEDILQGENITLEKNGKEITINAIGGSGGTQNYNDLENKPRLNGNELVGNTVINIPNMDNYYDKEECDDLFQVKKNENQIHGWTSITQNVESQLDIRPQLEQGYTRFTILVYLRKGSIRQGVKFELTKAELEKIGSKVNQNMVCITRSCLSPSGNNSLANVKQCVTTVHENGVAVNGLMNIMYNLYDYQGNQITSLDNFEWCMYAE